MAGLHLERLIQDCRDSVFRNASMWARDEVGQLFDMPRKRIADHLCLNGCSGNDDCGLMIPISDYVKQISNVSKRNSSYLWTRSNLSITCDLILIINKATALVIVASAAAAKDLSAPTAPSP